MPNSAEECIERLNGLKADRTNFDSLWQQASDVIHPHGGDFNTRHSPGEKRTEYLFEQTAANALETFTAAMEAFQTPRTQRWHKLKATDESLNAIPAVKAFFEQAEDVLFRLRNSPRARFYGQIYEVNKSLGLTGNGCLFVDEGPRGGIRYRYNHVGQTWIDTSFEGIVDSVYYEYPLTARAAMQKWGDDAPACAKRSIKDDPLAKHRYLHVVRPRRDRDYGNPGAEGKPWESLEISVDDKEVIGKSQGYEELPYIWTRYTVTPGEMYGRGPSQIVLPDVHTLQEMQKTFLRSGRKVADPPLLVHDDRQLGRGSKKVRIEPGGLNMGGIDADGRAMIQPLVTGARLDITEGMMDKLRENIERAYLVPLVDAFLSSDRQMTATEVMERAKEKGHLLTPVIGRQQAEFLGPLIERELGLSQRLGYLGAMPDELIEAEGEYEIEYESDATRMQRADEVAAFVRLQEVMAPFFQANPGLLEKIDAEEAMEHYGHDLGVPSKLFRTEGDMEQIHARQQQEQEIAAIAQNGPPIAGTVRDLTAAGAA